MPRSPRRAPSVLAVTLLLLVATGSTQPLARAGCEPSTADCGLSQRIAAADTYLAGRPGTVGYVLRDRATGMKFRNANAGFAIWTASTIKLAMVADLLARERVGALRLTDADRRLMAAMLRHSDNEAADTLWSRYGGPTHAFNTNFPRYGMDNVRPQPGFGDVFPDWGFQKGTADDFDALMNFVLTGLDRPDAAAVVAEMQRVDGRQQWGVWGAGPAMSPGNKNGWSQEEGGWVVNTVGFAGPQQRYTLAVMNALGDEGGYDDGITTTTELSRILLGPGT